MLTNETGYCKAYHISQQKQKPRHLYEMVKFDRPCIFYLDIDCHRPLSGEEESQTIEATNLFIIHLFKYYFDLAICIYTDIIILKSNCPTKFSLHILVRDCSKEVMFTNNGILKLLLCAVIDRLRSCLLNSDSNPIMHLPLSVIKHLFYNHNGKEQCIIDTSVYNKNKLFRTLWSCKKGRKDNFEYFTGPSSTSTWTTREWLLNTLITYQRPGYVEHFLSELSLVQEIPPVKKQNMSSFQPGTSATLKTHLLHSSVLRAIEEETAPNTVTKVVPGKKKGYFLLHCSSTMCPRLQHHHQRNRIYIILDVSTCRYWINCHDCPYEKSEARYLNLPTDVQKILNDTTT